MEIVFCRFTEMKNFQVGVICAIFLGLIFAKAQFISPNGIAKISCEFNSSTCSWRPFREGNFQWEISNSTQNSDVPDNNRNFLIVRGSGDGTSALVGMMISPHFIISSKNINLSLNVFCSGNPELDLQISEVMSGDQMDFLAEVDCPESTSWERIDQHVEDAIESTADIVIAQIVLVGTVMPGEVLAIQDLQFRDDTFFRNSSTFSSSSTEDLQTKTITSPNHTYTTSNSTEEDPGGNSTQSSTEDYINGTITNSVSANETTEDSIVVSSPNGSTSAPEISNSTSPNVPNHTSSNSSLTEEISTENINSSSSLDFENNTNDPSVPLQNSTIPSQSDPVYHTSTTPRSSESGVTQMSTAGPTAEMIIIQNSEFLWRSVFISTLAAFFVFSLLLLGISLVRKLLRKRKQWTVARSSRNLVAFDEQPEVIPLSVLNKA